MKPKDFHEHDELEIDHEDLAGNTFAIAGFDSEDLGVTEVVGVSLTVGCDRYAIEWATHSETAKVLSMETDAEWEIQVKDITFL